MFDYGVKLDIGRDFIFLKRMHQCSLVTLKIISLKLKCLVRIASKNLYWDKICRYIDRFEMFQIISMQYRLSIAEAIDYWKNYPKLDVK